MTTPLLMTKLYMPPVRPGLVRRPRLVERLNEGLRRGHRLTLISAPAGFGKTSLLTEWISESQNPDFELCNRVAWLSLDEGDNDPLRFWIHFIAAVQKIQAGLGEPALATLQSPQPAPAEALLTSLVNEISEIAEPFALVLDDFHAISTPQINDGFCFLLDNLPPPMHLFVSSRADPPWPLARLRARRQITELRTEDLRFTATEVGTFLNEVMELGLSAQDIAALDVRTEGWIAGIQLAALSMQGRADTSTFIRAFSGSHRFILDYLMEEVLDRQPADVQEFLLQTAVLERMTAPLCDAILEPRRPDDQETGRRADLSSSEILAYLERHNLFVIPLDDERRWYRYHRLFADLLRSRLDQALPGRAPALHRRASQWYADMQLVEEAVAHALAGQDVERATTLVEQHAMQMVTSGKLLTLSRWLEALPGDLVRTHPWLSVYRAWTQYWTGLREHVEESLQDAEKALERVPMPPESGSQTNGPAAPPGAEKPLLSAAERQLISGHVAAIRAYNALVYEKMAQVVTSAQRALDLLPEGEYMRCMAAFILGGAYWGRGDAIAAQEAFTKAKTAAQRCGFRYFVVSATCYVGMQQTKRAQLCEAFSTYQEALELATGPHGGQLPAAGYPSVKLGDLLREWNDLETASHRVTDGIRLCIQWGQVDALADSYIILARLQLAQGDLANAGSTLRKAEELMQRSRTDPWITCWLDEGRLRSWLSAGDLDAAVRWSQTSGLEVNGALSYQHDLHHLNLARVLVAQGMQQPSGPHLHEALTLLSRLLQAAERARWVNEAIKVLVLQAVALQALGSGEKALSTLARALALAEPGGYVRTFVDEGPPMRQLLTAASAQSVTADYAKRLLAAFELQVSGSMVSGRDVAQTTRRPEAVKSEFPLIEPLSPRELEVLRLLAAHLSRTDIARELFISVNTVRSHIKNIYSKLDVHKRRDAIQRAHDLRLL